MGRFYLSIPQPLALRLRDTFGLKTLVETGTYRAGTALWAASQFEQVYTIEGFEEYYRRNVNAHQGKVPNLHFLFGYSQEVLPEVLGQLTAPALVWLDAHYLGDTDFSVGTPGECALRDELQALNECGVDHFILIDDLHCFMGDLNKGSRRENWPDLAEIKQLIRAGHPDYYITTFDDVIVAVPPYARAAVDGHMRLPGMEVIVPTSNGYVGVLPGFAYLFNKFWQPTQAATVVRYEVRPPKLPPNFHNVAVGLQADYSWSRGLAAYLYSSPRRDPLLLLLDDYYLDRAVDLERLAPYMALMDADPEIAKIDLSGDLAKRENPIHKDGLLQASAGDPFRGSLQAALWRRDYLLGELEHDWTPWQFEKHACRGGLILGVKDPVLAYVNAVGGEGHNPGRYDLKKFPPWMVDELRRARVWP